MTTLHVTTGPAVETTLVDEVPSIQITFARPPGPVPTLPYLTRDVVLAKVAEAKRTGYPICEPFMVRPADVEELLVGTNFRTLDPTRVASYRSDIVGKLWHLNSQGISFDLDGNLANGQHRLNAVAAAGVEVPFMVTFIDEPVDTLDHTKVRKLADSLRNMGVPGYINVASTVNACMRLENGVQPTIGQAIEWFGDNQGTIDATRRAGQLIKKPTSAPVGAAGPFIYYANMIDPETLDVFLAGVTSGAGLSEHDPRLLLRNWFARRAATRVSRASSRYCTAMTFKAWNAFVGATPVRQLAWRQGTESFPPLLDIEGLPFERLNPTGRRVAEG